MFPAMNAFHTQSILFGIVSTTSPVLLLKAGAYPFFNTPAVVDVSGMEFGVAIVLAGDTIPGQTIASGATTVVFLHYDGGTTATNATGTNNLMSGALAFSNSVTGGWTVHQNRTGVGTSATDLDADDWVMVEVANISGAAGFGAALLTGHWIYGKPAVIN